MNSPSVRGARVTAARAQGRLDLIEDVIELYPVSEGPRSAPGLLA